MIFSHPLVKDPISGDGRDGMDAEPYDERNVRRALEELEEARKRQP